MVKNGTGKREIPPSLQAVLWSSDIRELDAEKDKSYIIHQVLSHGLITDWRWLFENYGKDVIREIFRSRPYKNYRAARFHFIKNFLLGLQDQEMEEKHYVQNTARDLG